MEIRKLDERDRGIVFDLIKYKESSLVEKKSNISDYYNSAKRYLDSKNEKIFLVGSIEDETLISMIGIYVWESMPCASLCFLFSRTKGIFNIDKNGLSMCYSKCISLCEQMGVFEWYLWLPISRGKAHIRSWKVGMVLGLEKYMSHTVARVPANTCSVHKCYFHLMDNRTWPFESEIRRTMLKPEFLKNLKKY